MNNYLESAESPNSKHGYLYSLWAGRLEILEGDVVPDSRNSESAHFYGVKRLTCSSEPGVVHNSTVWLNEENEVEARRLLRRQFHKNIYELQIRIDNLQSKIELLGEDE